MQASWNSKRRVDAQQIGTVIKHRFPGGIETYYKSKHELYHVPDVENFGGSRFSSTFINEVIIRNKNTRTDTVLINAVGALIRNLNRVSHGYESDRAIDMVYRYLIGVWVDYAEMVGVHGRIGDANTGEIGFCTRTEGYVSGLLGEDVDYLTNGYYRVRGVTSADPEARFRRVQALAEGPDANLPLYVLTSQNRVECGAGYRINRSDRRVPLPLGVVVHPYAQGPHKATVNIQVNFDSRPFDCLILGRKFPKIHCSHTIVVLCDLRGDQVRVAISRSQETAENLDSWLVGDVGPFDDLWDVAFTVNPDVYGKRSTGEQKDLNELRWDRIYEELDNSNLDKAVLQYAKVGDTRVVYLNVAVLGLLFQDDLIGEYITLDEFVAMDVASPYSRYTITSMAAKILSILCLLVSGFTRQSTEGSVDEFPVLGDGIQNLLNELGIGGAVTQAQFNILVQQGYSDLRSFHRLGANIDIASNYDGNFNVPGSTVHNKYRAVISNNNDVHEPTFNDGIFVIPPGFDETRRPTFEDFAANVVTAIGDLYTGRPRIDNDDD